MSRAPLPSLAGGTFAAPAWYHFRADVRRRWRAWLVLALVVGLAGGSVLALVAGARRTRSAYDRFLVAHDAYDVALVSGVEGVFDIAELDLDHIASLPQVADSAPLVAMAVVATTPSGETITPDGVNFAASPGDRFGGVLNRRKVLEGRMPDPARADEVAVSFDVADRFDLVVGDVLAANFIDRAEAEATFGGGATSVLPLVGVNDLEPLRVVGIAAVPNEFPPATDSGSVVSSIALTPAALATHPDNFNVEILALSLHGGAGSVPAFLAEVEALVPGQAPVFSISQAEVADQVRGALASSAGALTLSACLAGLVAALLVGQALARQAAAEADDEVALRAVGLTLGQVGAVRLIKAGAVAAVGALSAVVVAVALSPAFPVGLALAAEPDPGFAVDALTLGAGAPAVLAATVALVALSAWRAHRAGRIRLASGPTTIGPTTGRLVAALGAVGAPPAAVAGAHLGTDPRSRGTSMASRSSVTTIALGVATVLGALGFAASLDQLVSTPALYGWNWDEEVGSDFAGNFGPEELAFFESSPHLASVAVGNDIGVGVGDARMSVTGMDVIRGSVEPAMVAGAPPRAADELVLAVDVLQEAALGDVLSVDVAGREASFELVGRAVLPSGGGFATLDGLRRVVPDLQPQEALVSYVTGADRAAFRAQAADALALDEEDFFRPSLPTDLVNLGGVHTTPLVVAALMALVAVATLAHALVVATRRRAHDLGVLRVLGFTRRQTLATVACQALVLMVAALAVAVPLGIAAGRLTWLGFAERIGVVPAAVVPPLATLAVAVLALVVAQLAAAAPAWRAARVSAAVALRAE